MLGSAKMIHRGGWVAKKKHAEYSIMRNEVELPLRTMELACQELVYANGCRTFEDHWKRLQNERTETWDAYGRLFGFI